MKHLGLFAAGVLFGTAGLKILGSKDAKKVYSHTTAAVLRGAVARDPEHQVLMGADRELQYQKVVDIIDLVRGAGITKYALKVVRP